MCKILCFSSLSKIDLDQKTVSALKDIVCENDQDGFGYAVSDSSGAVFQYRTIETKRLDQIDKNKPFRLKGTKSLVSKSGSCPKGNSKAGIFHGRMSTNTVSLENTHPFALKSGGALIHNGVVYDHGDITDLKTDCDTEILARYWDSGKLDDISQCVSGYAAIAVLDDNKLHIARDNRATLFIAWSQKLETFIVATTIDILNKVSALLKADVSDINAIDDNTCMIFDGNSLVETVTFQLLEYATTHIDLSKVSAALGEDIAEGEETDEPKYYDDDCPVYDYEGFRVSRYRGDY